MIHRPLPLLLLSLAAVFPWARCAAADWPQFRGPAGTGAATDKAATFPPEWGPEKNVAWKVALPGAGWSQPIVLGDDVYVTAAVSEVPMTPVGMRDGVRNLRAIPGVGTFTRAPDVKIQWQVLCLDARTGKVRWTTTVVEGKPKHAIHPSNTYATETPAGDAKHVYALFGAAGVVAALDRATGEQRWKADLGAHPTTENFGTGGSLALADGRLFVPCFNRAKAMLLCLDAATGAEKWRAERPKPGSSWATPFVWRNALRTEVLAFGADLMTSHDPETGRELWRMGNVATPTTATPAADAERLYVGASSPLSVGPLLAIKAGASGDVSPKRGQIVGDAIAWSIRGAAPAMSSPVLYDGHLYVAGSVGLACYDAKTGQRKYLQRIPKLKDAAASLVAADGKVLVIDESGPAIVVKAGPAFEALATNELGETTWATPAIGPGGALYLRTVSSLYRISK